MLMRKERTFKEVKGREASTRLQHAEIARDVGSTSSKWEGLLDKQGWGRDAADEEVGGEKKVL